MPTVRETWDKMRQDALEQIKKAESGEVLLKDFPDMTIDINRWKVERYSSALANPKVTDCEFRHNCGCCNDSPIEIWPYLTTASGQRVYSNPAKFTCGEANYGNGERAYDGWAQQMRDKQIPEAIITKVQEWFDANKPEEERDE